MLKKREDLSFLVIESVDHLGYERVMRDLGSTCKRLASEISHLVEIDVMNSDFLTTEDRVARHVGELMLGLEQAQYLLGTHDLAKHRGRAMRDLDACIRGFQN